MALKTVVIVNSITNLSDARYCAGMGVEMLGFDLNPSSASYVQSQTFKVITEWVASIKRVGELQEAETDDLKELLTQYPIQYLQTAYSSDWKGLYSVGIPLICKLEWEEHFTASSFQYQYGEIANYVDFFLIQVPGNVFSKDLFQQIKDIAGYFPVLLGSDISANQIERLLTETEIKGIALKGSHEIRPGLKDFDDLAAILEVLETED